MIAMRPRNTSRTASARCLGGGVTPGVCGETYVVEPNDNPSLIAQKCGVDVDELMQINGIDDPTKLQIGQELILP